MTIYRTAAKADSVQNAIVKALVERGIDVWTIRQPCDLLLRFWCVRHDAYCWQPIEVKTPHGKKDPKARIDSRQERQRYFLEYTQTPVVISYEDAIRKLNALHRLAGIEVPCVLKTMPATV